MLNSYSFLLKKRAFLRIFAHFLLIFRHFSTFLSFLSCPRSLSWHTDTHFWPKNQRPYGNESKKPEKFPIFPNFQKIQLSILGRCGCLFLRFAQASYEHFAYVQFRGFGRGMSLNIQPNSPLRSATRPAMIASLFGSCPSGHGFATRFLQTLFRSNALALH